MSMLFTIVLLSIMEISLSFDNAVVNASVLKRMNKYWQGIFLTWGILFSVFIVRLCLPAIIVASSTWLSLPEVIGLALHNPIKYGQLVTASHGIIASFGGAFLLMVFLSFLLDSEKETHWIHWLEKFAADSSPTGTLEKCFVLSIMTFLIVLFSGGLIIPAIIGIAAFLGLEYLKSSIEGRADDVKMGISPIEGFTWFCYLEVLDASFSLDGVVGAFAISSDIFPIMIGLGIGSFAIRSLTVYMVRQKTLEAFTYLEHGAHYSIGALGLLMLLSNQANISQIFTGLIGVAFIGISILSSYIENKRDARS